MSKHHTKEYKEYVIKLVTEEGRKISDLSFELEIASSTISRWVASYKRKLNADSSAEKLLTPSEVKKLQAAYDKKLRNLEEENEILKKAMHIFAKNQV